MYNSGPQENEIMKVGSATLMRGMPENFLFMGTDIYDFVEAQRAKLRKAYEALPNEQALDETYAVELKKRFMLDIPRLRPEDWEADQRDRSSGIEVLAYIPFDGDPSVFNLRPSAFKSTVARGDIVDHDLRIRIVVGGPQVDIAGMVKREIAEVEWRLDSLRGSMEYMNQQLEGTLRACIAQRKRMVENKAQISQTIGIPLRKPASAPVQLPSHAPSPVVSKPMASSKPTSSQTPMLQAWDVFMSHASPDKPYVRGLVKALREAGVTVWYDDDSVAWGEPLRQAIKNGLKNSTYGIVVLSKAYLADRKWTEHEFDALFAREKLNSFIILPVWHGVTRNEIEAYDPALADRKGSISNSDDYGEIVSNVLKLLGRDVTETTPSASTSKKYKSDELELIAYVWYYTKDGNGAQMYVRKVIGQTDLFRLEEPDGKVEEGTREDIANKYSSIDRRLLRSGLTHHVRNSSSAYPDFSTGA
jgi:hypothetical protein